MISDFGASSNITSAINPQSIKSGFGSYLSGILPDDVATACGALSASFLQVRNIQNVPMPQLAQSVINLETMRGLTVNGTNVPTNLGLATDGHNIMANGCGPQGTYTASDFFGCMSGIPYNVAMEQCQKLLQDIILSNIYREMYLAVTWRPALISATTTLSAVPDGTGNFDYFYQVTGITIDDQGGGYSRGGAPEPIIFIDGIATAVVSNWTATSSDADVTTFGRITTITLTNSPLTPYGNGASNIPPPVTLNPTIQAPPTVPPGTIGPVLPVGYANTPPGTVGWPGMNAVVQNYINQANARISVIAGSNPVATNALNEQWNAIGLQLKREQRARNTAFYPLPPKSPLQPLSLSPTTIITWVDAVPSYAQSTQPHMYAQTIEAICNWGTIGGQSIVGLMRQERNAARLVQSGIPLDNNIPVTDQTINQSQDKTLIANGGSSTAPPNINNPSAPLIPAKLQITLADGTVALGYYDPSTDQYIVTASPYRTNGYAVDIGRPAVPGSFAGSDYLDLVSPPLNVLLTSGVLMPGTYTVDEAVMEVEKCNCDCWDQ